MFKNKKQKNKDISISVRLFDEKFRVIFGLTKENYKDGIKELDNLLKAKFGEGLNELLRDRERIECKSKRSNNINRNS